MLMEEWLLLFMITIYFWGILGPMGQYLTLSIFPILILKDGFFRYLDATCIWILVFSVCYTLISSIYGFNDGSQGSMIVFPTFPLLFYVTGRYLMDKWYSQRFELFLLLSIPIALTAMMSVFNDILFNGFQNMSRSLAIGEFKNSATLIGLRLSLCVVGIGMLFATTKNKKERFLQVFLVLIGILALIGTLHLLNRTGIVIALIASMLVLMANICRYSVQRLIIYFLIIGFGGYEVVTSTKDTDLVSNYVDREEEDEAGSVSAGGRTLRWQDGIEKIFMQPMGGGVFQNGRRYYAHNFWLDVSEIAGILPFIALLGCTLIGIWKNVEIILSRRVSSFFNSWLIVLNVGFFLSCFVEPIMEGLPTYAFLYFFFWGMTSSIYDSIKH